MDEGEALAASAKREAAQKTEKRITRATSAVSQVIAVSEVKSMNGRFPVKKRRVSVGGGAYYYPHLTYNLQAVGSCLEAAQHYLNSKNDSYVKTCKFKWQEPLSVVGHVRVS